MISVEPGFIDANVLVYALDAQAPRHLVSRNLLDTGRAGQATLYVTSQVLCEFYAVVTNPHPVAKVRSAADAIEAIAGLLAFLHVLPIPARTVEGWLDMLRVRPVTGGAVFDLHIASAMV
jgi:predicted nucleic acid-binding protein